MEYTLVVDTNDFVMESIHEVIRTLFEALILVMAVVLYLPAGLAGHAHPLPGRACFDCRQHSPAFTRLAFQSTH